MIELNLKPTPKQLRQFGLIALVAFSALGALVFYRGGLFGVSFGTHAATVALALLALAATSGVLALLWPAGNRPLFVLMTLVAFPIGLVVSHVALAIFFFLVITPFALVFRLIGRDPLDRRFDPEAKTYWSDLPEILDKKYYFKQY